jgi:hypothetical protein
MLYLKIPGTSVHMLDGALLGRHHLHLLIHLLVVPLSILVAIAADLVPG